MPKLGKYRALLNAVVFLYENPSDAEHGVKSGGTGFLLGVRSERWPNDFFHIHCVTNWHVAVCSDGGPPAPCVRVNLNSGKSEVFSFQPNEWIFNPGGADIAISPPVRLNPSHKMNIIDAETFLLTADEERSSEIGPGDDVFMVGRFVDYDGVEENAPAFRFGHLSIMDAHIHQHTGFVGRSIVLDMHSRSGFSGSPVFVYRTVGSHFFEPAPGKVLMGGGHYFKLLGIHWGQFPEEWELKSKPLIGAKSHANLITQGNYVEGLSGMTCAVPASFIGELLMNDALKEMRQQNELERLKIIGPTAGK